MKMKSHTLPYHGSHVRYGYGVLLLMSLSTIRAFGQSLEKKNLGLDMGDSIPMGEMIPMEKPEFKVEMEPRLFPSLSSSFQPLQTSAPKENMERFEARLEHMRNIVRAQHPHSIYSYKGIRVFGAQDSSYETNLISSRSAYLGATYDVNRFHFQAGLHANQYEAVGVHNQLDMHNQFGFGGSMVYDLTDKSSITLFGNYYRSAPFFSMATYPYVNSSSYGGYYKYEGEKAGVKLGAERYFDPYSRSWRTQPIVTPIFKLSNKVKIELPVGPLLQQVLTEVLQKRQNNSPNIMP